MRVLLISDRGANPGGTERYLANLASALRAAGDEVRVLAGIPRSASTHRGPGTVGGLLPADVSVADPGPPAARAVTQVINPSAVRALRRELIRFRPDAVHVAMVLSHLSPAVLALLGPFPTSLIASDLRMACPKGTKLLPDGAQCHRAAGSVCVRSGCLTPARAARDGFRQSLLRLGLSNVDGVLSCSRHVAGELAALGISASPGHLPIPQPAPDFRREPSPVPSFVFAGRLAPVKGVELLLHSLAALRRTSPEARLTIHGDGPDRGRIADLIARLGLADVVRMDPGMSLDWVESLRGATALVAPSLYREPLGMSVIESILHRTPVIASRGGGHAESVEEGVSGLLFESGSEEALTAAMRSMCRERPAPPLRLAPEVRDRLAQRHEPSRHLAELREIWEAPAGAVR